MSNIKNISECHIVDIENDKHQITKKCVEYTIRHRTLTTDICQNIE